ncbi:MAG: hypothetical protein HN368_18290 [Spirochaetales bacterium]|jgi:hypothetical protein|nr:hypothetical protein [Spirochaetales bacterium]
MEKAHNVERRKDLGGRDITLLTNGPVRVGINDKGGMIPEMSCLYGAGRINSHWLPPFRSNSGAAYNPDVHGQSWPVELLYELAGNFPCLPSFGGPNSAYGISHPAHGITANAIWNVAGHGTIDNRVTYLKSTIDEAASGGLPLIYTKYDLLIEDHSIHYAILDIRNGGNKPYSINASWHNTVGSPFLAGGCLIDTSAETFVTAPSPGEFDDTGRLPTGTSFENFSNAPLRDGGTVDLREVPGMIGYSDFASGAVPANADIGWSSVTNRYNKLIYLTFFKGPAAAGPDEVSLQFNDFWMQYGGRNMRPWAAYEGGTDYTFCLGTENAIAAYANGLQYSLDHPEVLGRPTTVTIEPGKSKRLFYGTAFFPYIESGLDAGIADLEWTNEGIAVKGRSGISTAINGDSEFGSIEAICTEIG